MYRRSVCKALEEIRSSGSTRIIAFALHREYMASPRFQSAATRLFASKRKVQILPRRPHEKTYEPKVPLPDEKREKELAGLQNEIHDLYRSGDYSRAVKTAKEYLKAAEAHFGGDHPVTACAYSDLGLMQKQLGDFDESRRNYKAALKIYKRTVGSDHASYAGILHNLGNLNRSQIHFDDTLSATDRLSLIESAAEYLEEAYTIRREELGDEHPRSVASRSSWGATLAAQILHNYKMSSPSAKTKVYIPILPESVAQQGWEAAETHLREALDTAIKTPRGPSLDKRKKKRGRVIHEPSEHAGQIRTLSAASAAQNLAIFLKSRATTQEPYNRVWLEEAHKLYKDVLNVRTQLMPANHPDLYATKHSLAELLEAMGDEEAANAIRQEVIDGYDLKGEVDEEVSQELPQEENKEEQKSK